MHLNTKKVAVRQIATTARINFQRWISAPTIVRKSIGPFWIVPSGEKSEKFVEGVKAFPVNNPKLQSSARETSECRSLMLVNLHKSIFLSDPRVICKQHFISARPIAP